MFVALCNISCIQKYFLIFVVIAVNSSSDGVTKIAFADGVAVGNIAGIVFFSWVQVGTITYDVYL